MTESRRVKLPAAIAISVLGNAYGALFLHNRGEPAAAVLVLSAYGTVAVLTIYLLAPRLDARNQKSRVWLLLGVLLSIAIVLFLVT